ncbi:MAG: hypothetical protein HYU77_02820 [Betaproteobacteria bacterium]|nr:hypothetical protein [Betaproteobacteria bacterium]
MQEERASTTIDEAFSDGRLIDEALAKSVQEALRRHKQAGNPVVEWRDGKIVWVAPEQITVEPAHS